MIRVAIDGPAGVGKSSTSKALAKYFGFAYLDTGAMYRACAWWCLKQGIDLDAEQIDERMVTETVGEFFTGDHFDISVDPDNPAVSADGEDISEAIRSSEVSTHVSKVSNIIPVRNVLIAAQRAYIAREESADSFSGGLGVVAEGRDITTFRPKHSRRGCGGCCRTRSYGLQGNEFHDRRRWCYHRRQFGYGLRAHA